MKIDPILQRIDEVLGEMEGAKEELQIALNLASITMEDYILIKRGSLDMPQHLTMWNFEEINISAEKLKEKLDQLNKLRRELFVI